MKPSVRAIIMMKKVIGRNTQSLISYHYKSLGENLIVKKLRNNSPLMCPFPPNLLTISKNPSLNYNESTLNLQ
jgi:hypothetical protein